MQLELYLPWQNQQIKLTPVKCRQLIPKYFAFKEWLLLSSKTL